VVEFGEVGRRVAGVTNGRYRGTRRVTEPLAVRWEMERGSKYGSSYKKR
jgi:hypothetical protein